MSQGFGANSSTTESNRLERLGAGSFATIFVLHGQAVVYKVVRYPERASELRTEFETLHSLNLCYHGSVFTLPRAFAYYDPVAKEVTAFPPTPPVRRVREPRTVMKPSSFLRLGLTAPTYVLDRAHILPRDISDIVRELYYPEWAKNTVDQPMLCRLYFGKACRISSFVNPINFPIDATRYMTLFSEEPEMLLPIAEIAQGMGEMLGSIHWVAGFDGRDIEFVMGGDGYGGVRYYVIDFNQMHHSTSDESCIDALSGAFFANDPYYPLPRPSDQLYEAFKSAYVDVCPVELRHLARAFIQTIESAQASRDQTAVHE
ncbi:hypothetical protein A0H81_05758 [Grifola frondosa]|uniref:DUF3669 domain-containing protein n=1 Tax=Grifola frondosa TaxID=5627 RepID=A0A1C7MBU1_GRIFR|nr:hypothetical protein A0H81_05758 [Grifola frondosa]